MGKEKIQDRILRKAHSEEKEKLVKEIFLREERKKLEEGSIKETQGQEFSRGKE